jgi:malonate-semialdehyde dehydrogenase (acetylating)/methylmalonate-semialdehyde dehydrogenase
MTSKPAVLADQVPTVKMLLDGKFIDSRSDEWHEVVNPATQEVLAHVPFATGDELDAAVASAKRATRPGGTRRWQRVRGSCSSCKPWYVST